MTKKQTASLKCPKRNVPNGTWEGVILNDI